MLNSFLTKSLFIVVCLFVFSGSKAFSQKAIEASSREQFLAIADIHFDPFLACTAKPCPLIQKLQEVPAEQWKNIFLQKDTSSPQYGKDSNYSIFHSALEAAKKEGRHAKIRFVIVLGDFLAHRYDKKYFTYSGEKSKSAYRAFVKKTMLFLASEFNQAFPQVDVYWIIGNNDSYGKDYAVELQGLFFKDFSELAAPLVKNKNNRLQLLRNFPEGGYYAVNAPQEANLRLIFLNSVLFSDKAKGLGLEKAAEAQLNWLQKELAMAKALHQKVFIAMHIPTGVDVYATLFIPFTVIEFWKAPYSQRFLTEIQRASAEISGIFTAHIHADAFQIFADKDHQAIPFISTPSISPIFGNNPAFKIFSYSTPNLRLVDFVTYYKPLGEEKEWQKEYDFDEVYQLNHQDNGMLAGMFRLQSQGELADHYRIYYAVSTNSQPITKYNKWMPYYWCAIRNLTSMKYQNCLVKTH